MATVADQKGRATPIHIQCSKCGRTYEAPIRATNDREENDRRFGALLAGAGWAGDYLNPLGKPLICHRCKHKPPHKTFKVVDPRDPKTWGK